MSKVDEFEAIYGEGLGDNRRVPREARKTHDIKVLSQRHHNVISMKLLGASNKSISAETGMTPEAVSLILNSTLARRKMRQMRMARDGHEIDRQKKIHELSVKALAVYEEILDAEDEIASLPLKKSTADVITRDLSGLRAPIRTEGLLLSGQLSEETVSRITERGIAAARELGIVVDVVAEAKVVGEDE